MNLGLVAMGGLLATATFHTDVMAAAADGPEVAATDLAEHLVAGGLPFRDAHALVGALVRRSLTDGVDLSDLVGAEPQLGPEAVALLGPGVAVRSTHHPRWRWSGSGGRPAGGLRGSSGVGRVAPG